MPSTYTTNLGIEKIATGEQSGTWGTTTNTNLDLIDQAVNGVEQVTLSVAGSSGSPNDLPITNGASSDGRNKFIEFVDGADLGGTAYVQLTPNDAEKIVFFRNSLSASRSVIVFQGTYNASNDFEIPNGADVVLKFDGAGAGAVVSDVYVNLTPTKLTTANLVATSADINGGTIDGATLGGNSQVTITDADINGGTIDGVTIGGASAGAGTFTTFTSTGIDDNATSNAITIDSSERVIIGHTSALSTQGGPLGLQSIGANTTSGLDIFTGGASALPRLNFTRSRNATPGSNTILQDDDRLGLIMFMGDDGTDYQPRGAQILAEVDGTPGANDMPGRLAFYTTSDGADSSTERMRITNAGNVGIGTSSPVNVSAVPDLTVAGKFFTSDGTPTNPAHSFTGDQDTGMHRPAANTLAFGTGGSEAMRIDSSQRVLIGTTTSEAFNGISSPLQIEGSTANTSRLSLYRASNDSGGPTLVLSKSRSTAHAVVSNGDDVGNVLFYASDGSDTNNLAARIDVLIDGTPGTNDTPGRMSFSTTADGASSSTERMRIQSNGRVRILNPAINTSRSSANLLAQRNNFALFVSATGADNVTGNLIQGISFGDDTTCGMYAIDAGGFAAQNIGFYTGNNTGVNERFVVNQGGAEVVGTLSKSSGSFKIDHPLESKTDTHHLVHSFVEAPQADNIYRGKVDLVAGSATVNIDTVAGMTDGTFVALNREVQCFTSNESGWTAVRGSVSGNILTIEAQDNTCTDTISWLVVGERHDPHMYDTEMTDSNGKVIVEPLKAN